jgi:hypothetical protein
MDILFDLQNGIYRIHGNATDVGVELFINVGCLVGGAAIVCYAWRHRRYLMALPP